MTCPRSQHLTLITYTRRRRILRRRRRWWIRCWDCPLRMGPYGSYVTAESVRRLLEVPGS